MTKTGGGLCDFLKKLREIKSSHKKAQEFYKTLIFLHPHLKYIPIEQCPDYKHALKLKFHLSFLLGQAIIKADKAWFKGGYLKLNDYIKEAKETFREFKEYENEVDSFVLALIFENNAQILLKDKNLKESLIDLLNSLNLNQKEAFVRNLLKFAENLDSTLNLNSGLNSGLKNSNLNSSLNKNSNSTLNLNSSLSQNSNKNLNSSSNLNQALNSNSNLNKTLNSSVNSNSSKQTLNSKQNPIQQAFQNESFRKDLGLFLKDFLDLLKTFKDYEALNESLKHNLSFNFAFLYENLSSIKTWLSSSEFKEKFHNHPYPSLLNPEKIEYESINAELAWDLNLPLPPFYELIYLCPHGAGVAKVREFLISGGVYNIYSFTTIMNCKKSFEIYTLYYQRLLSVKYPYISLELSGVAYQDLDNFYKFLALVDKKVSFFCQVRDPIEVLTHLFKRTRRYAPHLLVNQKEFDINSKFEDLVVSEDKSRFNHNLTGLQNNKFASAIVYKILLKALEKNIVNIEFLDTKELNSPQIIPIMQRIAAKLKMPVEKILEQGEECKKLLQNNVFQGSAYLFLPLIFNVSTFKISIRTVSLNTNEVDLYEEICGKKSTQIGIYINKQDLENFRKDAKIYQDSCVYLKNFIEKLETRMEQENQKTLKIDDVMQYFRQEPQARKHIKNSLDDEVAIIKKYRPDIVASWKYYAEFEKICAELDG